MDHSRRTQLAAGLVGLLALSAPEGATAGSAAQGSHFEKLANLPFSENRPTKETSQVLRDELLFQRATQT